MNNVKYNRWVKGKKVENVGSGCIGTIAGKHLRCTYNGDLPEESRKWNNFEISVHTNPMTRKYLLVISEKYYVS